MKKFNFGFFIVVLLFGWFGIDKFLMRNFRLGLIKFLSTLLGVGVVWNLYDIVCVLINKYKTNPFGV